MWLETRCWRSSENRKAEHGSSAETLPGRLDLTWAWDDGLGGWRWLSRGQGPHELRHRGRNGRARFEAVRAAGESTGPTRGGSLDGARSDSAVLMC